MADLTTITAASFLDNQAQFCYWCNVKWKVEMKYGLELSQVSFILFYIFVFGHTTISVECNVEYIQFNYLKNISFNSHTSLFLFAVMKTTEVLSCDVALKRRKFVSYPDHKTTVLRRCDVDMTSK